MKSELYRKTYKAITLIIAISAGIVMVMTALPSPAATSDHETFLAATWLTQEELAEQRWRNTHSYLAQCMCSAVFLQGRDPQEAIENDFSVMGEFDALGDWKDTKWKDTKWEVDRDGGRVTVWAPKTEKHLATPRYTAVYTPGLGSSLLPVGAERTSFEPVDARSTLPPAGNQSWPLGDVDAVGTFDEVDTAALEAALDFAFDDTLREQKQKTRAIVVVYRDKIIAERYGNGWSKDQPHIGWSAGKSVAGALFGIAVKEYGIDVKAPAPIAEWQGAGDPRGQITPEHLLWMSGGLKFHSVGGSSTYYLSDMHDHEAVYFRGQNNQSFVINRPLQYIPGTVYQYRNANTLSLMAIIKRKNEEAGENHLTWPRRMLFDKIGARNFILEPDAFGNFVITGYDYAPGRDWARLGLLYLHDGMVNGERLWPEGWSTFVSTPSPTNERYGGQIWLNSTGRWPDVPTDAYYASGYLGERTVVIPSRDMVIVRLGLAAEGGFRTYFNEVLRRILAAVER